MPKYISGKATRSKILYSAKHLFFNNGVNETSLQDIANDAGINQSLLYYYFADKNELIIHIHRAFSASMNGTMLEEIKARGYDTSPTVERCLLVALYFKLTLKTPKLMRFLSQVNEADTQLRSSIIREKYQILMDEHPHCKALTTLDYVMLENISLNMVLFRLYIQGKLNYTHEELIRFKLSVIAKSLYIPKEEWLPYEREILRLNDRFNLTINDQFEVSVVD